jgi:hypothetical protein
MGFCSVGCLVHLQPNQFTRKNLGSGLRESRYDSFSSF